MKNASASKGSTWAAWGGPAPPAGKGHETTRVMQAAAYLRLPERMMQRR